jgi:hypothetical protein
MPLTRYDVFTPGDFPRHSYVHRQFVHPLTARPRDPEGEIRDAFRQRGRIAQIVGPSKSGKTVALKNVVQPSQLQIVSGSRITTPDSIWSSVTASLGLPSAKVVADKRGEKNGNTESAALTAKFGIADATGSLAAQREQSKERSEQVTVSEDVFRTATSALVTGDKVLFLDDFHAIPASLKQGIASQLKAAAESGVRICLAEVPHRADEPVAGNLDLTGRIAKITFDYWSTDDLKAIATIGFASLKLEVNSSAIDVLAHESAGSPQLMQLLCLEVCKELAVDQELATHSARFLDANALDAVFMNVVQSVERAAIFKVLDEGPDERGKPRAKYQARGLVEGDNYEITLASVALDPPRLAFDWDAGPDSLQSRMNRICPRHSNRPLRHQITRAQEQLRDLALKYMPRTPVLDWDADKGLHILDPYFLYYLRWHPKYLAVRRAVMS